MFERLKTWIKGGLQRMAANTGMAREFKDIFELGGDPAYSQFYYFGIFIWKYLYRGYYAPWHMIPAPTIKDPLAKRKMYRMDMAKAVSAELASLIDWGLRDELDTSVVEDDYDPVLPAEPKSRLGDIYQLGNHRLMCGDSTSLTDVQKLVGGGTNGFAAHRPPVQCGLSWNRRED